MFETTSHDFGSIARGAKAEYAFEITNNVTGDVHISGVRSSCGCTTPRITKETIKTYEKGAIIAHLNSDTHLGQRHATVIVSIDQPVVAEVQLTISAMVHSDIDVSPSSIQLGAMPQGTGASGVTRIYRSNDARWQITGVKFSNSSLSGKVIQLARRGSEVWYDLHVKLAADAPVGYIADHALLTTNDPAAPEMPIMVEGQVQASIVASPATLFLGVMQPGDKVTKTLVIHAAKPFHIKSLEGDATTIAFDKTPDDAKAIHIVPVTFLAGADVGKVVKTIKIQTDASSAPLEISSYAVVNAKPLQP